MVLHQSKSLEPIQRVRVEAEPHRTGERVKIRVESYDERLGWYTSGSLSLAWNQLPLLEQALADMRAQRSVEATSMGKIIPFLRPDE